MLKVEFIGDCLQISMEKPRLCGLTVYNGCPSIDIHYVADEDLDSLINALMREEYSRQTKDK